MKSLYMPIFMFVVSLFASVSVIEIRTALQPKEEEDEEAEDEEHDKSVNVEITSIIPVLQDFLVFF